MGLSKRKGSGKAIRRRQARKTEAEKRRGSKGRPRRPQKGEEKVVATGVVAEETECKEP